MSGEGVYSNLRSYKTTQTCKSSASEQKAQRWFSEAAAAPAVTTSSDSGRTPVWSREQQQQHRRAARGPRRAEATGKSGEGVEDSSQRSCNPYLTTSPLHPSQPVAAAPLGGRQRSTTLPPRCCSSSSRSDSSDMLAECAVRRMPPLGAARGAIASERRRR